MRFARLAASCSLMPLLVGSFWACRAGHVSDIGLVMSAPQGVLDDATRVTLKVFPAEGKTCAEDGGVDGVPADATSFNLTKSQAGGTTAWEAEITLERGDTEQMFFVEVAGDAGLLAQGCNTAVIDQDPVEVNIKVVRFVEPDCCGDGVVQATELCDEGGDDTCGGSSASAACAADCTTIPVVLDDDGLGNPVAVGQTHLALAFAPGSDQLDGGLRAAWNWSETSTDLGIRALQSDLTPVTEPEQLAVAHRVYFRCSGTDQPANGVQESPSITALGNGAALAFLSSEQQPLRLDASVLFLNDRGCSDMLTALVVSDESSGVDDIDVASGPSNTALVVWEQNGRVFGRTFDGTDLGSETLTISDDGAAPRVAGYSGGWAVVYQGPGSGDDNGVFLRRVGTDLSLDAATLVNASTGGAQDQPDVAAAGDGALAVVFRSGQNVFFQRFSPSDERVAGDQDAGIAAAPSDGEASPVVAAASSGDFFVAAWQSGNQIRSRFLGKSAGFLFNNVTGQNDDFDASAGATAPTAPAVAVGDFVAIGWDDQSSSIPGVIVRRFPLPN